MKKPSGNFSSSPPTSSRRRGYLHYEVANFAREEEYVCRHNRSTGPGPPTWGWVRRRTPSWPGRRWWNFSSVGQYCSSLNAGEAPVAEAETLTPEQIRLETLYLGFRTREGVSLAIIREQPRGDAMLAELTQAGLVRVDHDRVIATAKAWWWPTACPWGLRIDKLAGQGLSPPLPAPPGRPINVPDLE